LNLSHIRHINGKTCVKVARHKGFEGRVSEIIGSHIAGEGVSAFKILQMKPNTAP